MKLRRYLLLLLVAWVATFFGLLASAAPPTADNRLEHHQTIPVKHFPDYPDQRLKYFDFSQGRNGKLLPWPRRPRRPSQRSGRLLLRSE